MFELKAKPVVADDGDITIQWTCAVDEYLINLLQRDSETWCNLQDLFIRAIKEAHRSTELMYGAAETLMMLEKLDASARKILGESQRKETDYEEIVIR